ncbi:MAG: ABC transporter substrate-binding protein [Proteobacteria bacterium]|nr:ABC transporter substrate-binding protein [Pseudomonadota bacterium]
MNKAFLNLSLVLTLVLALALPAWAEPVASPIPIGLALATSSNVAHFGQEQVNGAKIAEAYLNAQGGVNGTPITLLLQDTAGDEAGAVSAFQNLIAAKVVGIVGPTLSQQAFAADPLANRAAVPVVAPSNTAKGITKLGDYISRVSAPMGVVAPKSVQKALALDPRIKRAAVLYAQNDAYSTSETGVFQQTVKANGLKLVSLQKFQTTDTDFSAKAAAVLKAKAELVVISGLAEDSSRLVRQLRQSGYKGLIVGGNGFNSPNMFPLCGAVCDGVLVAQAYSPHAQSAINQEFIRKFSEAYGSPPAQFAAQAFTAVQVMVEALRKAEQTTGKKITALDLAEARKALNTALTSGLAFHTPLGEISITSGGEVDQKRFYVSRITISPDGKTGDFVLAK